MEIVCAAHACIRVTSAKENKSRDYTAWKTIVTIFPCSSMAHPRLVKKRRAFDIEVAKFEKCGSQNSIKIDVPKSFEMNEFCGLFAA